MEGLEFNSNKSAKDSEFAIYDKHNLDKNSRFPPSENSKAFQPKNAA